MTHHWWTALVIDTVTHVARVGGWLGHHPALAAAAVVTVLAGGYMVPTGVGRWVAGRRHARLADHASLVTITPPPEADPDGGAVFWSHLHGLSRPAWQRLIYGNPHLVWEYHFNARTLTIRLWVPGTIPPGLVSHAVSAAWPGATCRIHSAPTAPLPAGVPRAGGWLRPDRGEALPLRTDHETDALRAMLDAGAATRDGEHTLVQVVARPASPARARTLRRAPTRRAAGHPHTTTRGHLLLRAVAGLLEAVARTGAAVAAPSHRHHHLETPRTRSPGDDAWRSPEVTRMLDKTGGPLWETHLRYTLTADPHGREPGPTLRRLAGRAGTIAAAFAVYASPTNTLRRHRAPRGWRRLVAERRFGSRGYLLSVAELASLAHLPTDTLVAGLDRAGARPTPAPAAVPAGGRATKPLGIAQVSGRAVALTVPDARYHLHIPGKTGTGKSTAIAHLVASDVAAGRGAVVIDPGGDLVTDILQRLPASAAERVWLMDPDTGHPPRINPLDGPDPHLATDQLVGMFATIFARHWGPRADDVLRSACLTLLHAGHATPTLELLVPLLTSKHTRAPIVARLNDSAGLGGFWTWYDELSPGIRAQVVGPVLARMRQFLLRDFVRASIGNPRPGSGPALDMPTILNHGGLLLCRLPKGQLGDDTARLLGSFVVAQVWKAATARTGTPEADRRDCSLYIDECHNFLTLPGSVDDMLAEARKLRLSMVLAHQNLTQLPRELRDALSANARNKLFFTISPDDARHLARHTLPELTEHDLAHLDAYTAAARLVVDARETRAFTLTTRPPQPAAGHAELIRTAWTHRGTGHQHPATST